MLLACVSVYLIPDHLRGLGSLLSTDSFRGGISIDSSGQKHSSVLANTVDLIDLVLQCSVDTPLGSIVSF